MYLGIKTSHYHTHNFYLSNKNKKKDAFIIQNAPGTLQSFTSLNVFKAFRYTTCNRKYIPLAYFFSEF